MKARISLEIPNYDIFDFHRHVSIMEEFEKNITKFNIKRFCLMPSMLEDDFNDLEAYIEKTTPYIQKYGERAIIFGFIDFSLNADQNKELLTEQKKKINIRGIKIHPEQAFNINRKSLDPFFRAIADILGYIPIYIHMDWPLLEENGYAPQGKKKTFNRIVSFFPEFNFIMGHAGGSGDYLNVWKSCKKYPNVYIETSMAPVTSTLSEVVWNVGTEKLLFGSNYPYCGTSVEIVKILNMYKVSEKEKRAILESNWEGLFLP